MRPFLVASAIAVVVGSAPVPTAIRWRPAVAADVPAQVVARLGTSDAAGVESWLGAGRRDAADRLRDGAWDHTVAFVLQSDTFTTSAPIEPALSARTYVQGGRVPNDVRNRLRAFARVVAIRSDLRAWVPEPVSSADDLAGRLEREYARSMAFLHEQTYAGHDADDLATLYQARGLSTDTSIEVGYAVHDGLGVVAALRPLEVRRVLVVGPGLESAPRTGLDPARVGQSYQPLAILDSLRRLGAAHDDIAIDVVDVNPTVVSYFAERAAADGRADLLIRTYLRDIPGRPMATGVHEYLSRWGALIGKVVDPMQRTADGRWQGRVDAHPEAWRRVHAQVANVALDVPDRAAYDLVVATNVLAYLDDARMQMALAVLRRAMVEGGWLLHNDRRTALAGEASHVGLPLRQLRTVTFTQAGLAQPAVYDLVLLHEATPPDMAHSRNGARVERVPSVIVRAATSPQ